MKYRELRKEFKKAGWQKLRQNGSHEIWGKGEERETIAGKDSDDIPTGLARILKKRIGMK